MLGWILYKHSEILLKPEAYEVHRLKEIGEKHGIEFRILQPEQIDIVVTREDRKSILVDDTPSPLPDFIIPRMGAGTTYFALAVIRHLERLGVYSFNSANAVDTVKDKLYHLQILAEQGIPIPKTMLAKFPLNIDHVQKYIGYPAVIKTLAGSQGSGVFLSQNKAALEDLMQLVEVTNPKSNIIIQEFVKKSFGRDLRVFVAGGRVIGAMERSARKGDFKANYSRGGKVKNFEVTPEIEWLVLETVRVLGLDIAGVDLLFDEDGYKICEVNSSPGFEGLEKATEKNIAEELIHYIKLRVGGIS